MYIYIDKGLIHKYIIDMGLIHIHSKYREGLIHIYSIEDIYIYGFNTHTHTYMHTYLCCAMLSVSPL
jgi:hypothetical protein